MTLKLQDILIGIDYGDTNIGIALGRNGFVSPITIISGKNTLEAINEITRTALENKAVGFVVGLSLTADGKETIQSKKIRRFTKLLKSISKKQIVFLNEFMTSQEAYLEAMETDVSSKRGALKDHLAAALILKKYYNSLN